MVTHSSSSHKYTEGRLQFLYTFSLSGFDGIWKAGCAYRYLPSHGTGMGGLIFIWLIQRGLTPGKLIRWEWFWTTSNFRTEWWSCFARLDRYALTLSVDAGLAEPEEMLGCQYGHCYLLFDQLG
ncbi:hypothetical protein Nepgr_019586 [Nepenthes gracilis]|uniref:Uncharacterized protein n=1 Tax=Nepenthes gracilis TaxID=150966 RepID=A0AAD3XVD5_NEPGR|nr:hypothetical protein Nepgr_019586 [Nepenthes gracilis]